MTQNAQTTELAINTNALIHAWMAAPVERVQNVKQRAIEQFADVQVDGVVIPRLNVLHVGYITVINLLTYVVASMKTP